MRLRTGVSKSTTELKDLEVERVDGVDKPATGRHFILFKNETGGDVIKKGYGALATVAAEVLKCVRKDGKATVSRSTAVALNGLAQLMEQSPVFVDKSVPTQPYEFSEPDVDKRGPDDENIGANFTPHSMPGAMVGAVSFRLTEEAQKSIQAAEKAEAAKAAKDKKDDEDDDNEEFVEEKKSASAIEQVLADLAKSQIATQKMVTELAGVVKAAIGEAEQVSKSEEVEDERPRSRQITDEERTQVRKGEGRTFGVSFADIVSDSPRQRRR